MFYLKRLAVLLVSGFLLSSCLGKFVENDLDQLAKDEEVKILEYGQTNNLPLTKLGVTGIYYNLSKSNPTGLVSSSKYDLLIEYTIKTLEGSVIDSKKISDALQFNFYTTSVFEGFRNALLTLKEGEKGTFLIPSYQAYYDNPPVGINKYQILIAEIELVDLLSEDDRMDNYIKKKEINLTEKTASGLRFIRIDNPTASDSLKTNDSLKTGDNVTVKYNGMFLTEKSFDSGSFSIVIGSNSAILGFTEGISKLKKGEKAKLIFPSTLGYGDKGNSSIPPYTPLMFDVEIVTVNGL
jgi:FKBP-type peptidyl-prolyl cis-trans isomerase